MAFDQNYHNPNSPPHLGLCGCRECGICRSEQSEKNKKPEPNSWMPEAIKDIEKYLSDRVSRDAANVKEIIQHHREGK